MLNSYRAAAYAVKALQQQRQGNRSRRRPRTATGVLQTELTEHQIDKLQNLMAGLQASTTALKGTRKAYVDQEKAE